MAEPSRALNGYFLSGSEPSRTAASRPFCTVSFSFTNRSSSVTMVRIPNTRAKPPVIRGMGARRRSRMKPTARAIIEAMTSTQVALIMSRVMK